MKLSTRQLYYIFLAAVVVSILVSCKKHVEPEQKWRTPDDKPLEHRSARSYDLPELDEDDLDDLPEAGEEDEE